MTSNQPATAVEALERHGMRAAMHPLNRDHFRRLRRAEHLRTAKAGLEVAAVAATMIVGFYILVALCYVIG